MEKRDVASFLSYVLGSGQATSIGLWGRSMGAVTAILAGDLHQRFIRVIIADSAFASLPRLVQDVAQGRSTSTPKPLVSMIVSLGLKLLGETVKQRAQFRIADVDPISVVENCSIPTLYMHADRDGFVLPEHSRDLHARCARLLACYCEVTRALTATWAGKGQSRSALQCSQAITTASVVCFASTQRRSFSSSTSCRPMSA